jgi:hypothetical protein
MKTESNYGIQITNYGINPPRPAGTPPWEGNTGTKYKVEISNNIITPSIPLTRTEHSRSVGGVSAGRGGLFPLTRTERSRSVGGARGGFNRYALSTISSLTAYTIQKNTLKSTIVLLLVLLSITASTQAQNNVGIGTTTPNPKAILDLQATDKGLLTPRMTTAQMNAIVAPPSGLLIYNTDDNCFNYYNNGTNAWKSMCTTTGIANSGDTVIINLLKADSIFANYIKIDSAFIANLFATYIKADSAYIKLLTSQYIVTDSIKAGFGRFDSLYINGQNITNYINSQLSNKDTVVLKYLRTDSLYSMLIKADSAFINHIATHFIKADTLVATWGQMDSLYIGGQNILQTISDSIAAQAWITKGNIATNNYKLGTLNARDLHIVANNTEAITIANGTRNVGIGQTLPSQKLDVIGNVQFTGALMPASVAGNAGEILISAGAGIAPIWTNASSINTNTIAGTGTVQPLVVLNGAGDLAYKNAPTQGVVFIAPNNTCWKLTVSNTGAFVSQSVTCP